MRRKFLPRPWSILPHQRPINMMRWRAPSLLFIGLLAVGGLHAEVAVPPLVARVTDLTATLAVSQRQELENRLAQFEAGKGAQIAVLIVPTTQPETIEQYAIRVAEQWRLGRKGVDDGVLLLIAKQDRALRIEVGYGLEGALNDATAKRIISEIIVPQLKRGDYYGGIAAGVTQITAVITGESLPGPQDHKVEMGGYASLQSLLMAGIVLAVVIGGVLRALLGRLPAAAIVGLVTGLLAWMIVAPVAVALFIAIIAFFFTLAGGARGHWGGGIGRGGLGGEFGSGGFGGGGGGFGGGGASGRW